MLWDYGTPRLRNTFLGVWQLNVMNMLDMNWANRSCLEREVLAKVVVCSF